MRPKTNHKVQGDMIKTTNLQINQFSEEVIAQLKYSQNLVVADDSDGSPHYQEKDSNTLRLEEY